MLRLRGVFYGVRRYRTYVFRRRSRSLSEGDLEAPERKDRSESIHRKELDEQDRDNVLSYFTKARVEKRTLDPETFSERMIRRATTVVGTH